jgi:hypothetical protein
MFEIHNTFPREMAVIGRLLLDYGELELDLMNCIQVVRNYDMNSTLKAMFRIRGEMSRIQIADALGRVPYAKIGLEAEFSAVIDGIDHCRKIRNKYAHTYWHDPDMGKALCYVALEELAVDEKPVNDLTNLTFFTSTNHYCSSKKPTSSTLAISSITSITRDDSGINQSRPTSTLFPRHRRSRPSLRARVS